MPVSPNAAPSELSSPFFIENEKICHSFDEFIVAKNGETRGKYNAFSYNVIGKVRHPNKWEFRIQKSSFTSGNLLLSSKYQSLHVASIWTAKILKSDCPNFYIRKKKTFDFLKMALSRNWNFLLDNGKYVIKCADPNHELINDLKGKLGNLFELQRVWELRFENSELKIEIRSESTHTEIIEKFLVENYTYPPPKKC